MRNIALLLVTMTAALFVTVGVALANSSAPTNETTSSAPTNETTSSVPAEEVTSSAPVDETTSSAPTDETTTVDTTTVDTDTTGAAEERVIELESRPTALRNFVDVEGDGPSPGDIYVFRNKLFDGQGDTAEKVGQAVGRCNLIRPATKSFVCTIVSTLKDGSITTDGILTNAKGATSVQSVTGGTGEYVGATGEGSLELSSVRKPYMVRFVLEG
jgi:hypothetical protein